MMSSKFKIPSSKLKHVMNRFSVSDCEQARNLELGIYNLELATKKNDEVQMP